MLPASCALALLVSISAAHQSPDSLDRVIRREMGKRGIPGLSIAVIDSGRIVLARAYGVTKRGTTTPVTTNTLFQAGSISKAVTAVGAMRLVERGTLQLDRDVNEQLVSWKVPDTTVAGGEKLTVRELLSHSAGLNVHGFPGYALSAPYPNLVQVLNGAKPANTEAIRIVQRPGVRWEYSGGGYTILQQLMIDVTHQRFDEYMMHEVLTPAGMTASTFAQPLPAPYAPNAATGHTDTGEPVPGGWHAYPEMAAAGLWTTPTDLAKFAMSLQRAFRRDNAAFLSAELADQMLSYQRNDFMGLGLFLRGNNVRLEFSHNGRDEGFDASMTATALTGQGVVIMINTNDNSAAVERIQRSVAHMYNWPNYRKDPVPPSGVAADASALSDVAGRYELRSNQMVMFAPRDGHLYSYADGHEDEEFVPVGPDRFTRVDGDVSFQFQRDAARRVIGTTVFEQLGTRAIPRVGPLVTSMAVTRDPDPSRTKRIEAILRAMAAGKANDQTSVLAAGALRDFRDHVERYLVGVANVSYAAEEDVSDRGLTRHDGVVARIVYVKALIGALPRYVLVHFTKDGLVTDYDVVVR
jgi:CubicO group peptidase (beta-lactamase class C family)